jgi:hypothetical protein
MTFLITSTRCALYDGGRSRVPVLLGLAAEQTPTRT